MTEIELTVSGSMASKSRLSHISESISDIDKLVLKIVEIMFARR